MITKIIKEYEKEGRKFSTLLIGTSPNDLKEALNILHVGKGFLVNQAKENPNMVIVDGDVRVMWVDKRTDVVNWYQEVKEYQRIYVLGLREVTSQLSPSLLFPQKLMFLSNVVIDVRPHPNTLELFLMRDINFGGGISQTFEL